MALRKLATNYTLLSYHNNSFIQKKLFEQNISKIWYFSSSHKKFDTLLYLQIPWPETAIIRRRINIRPLLVHFLTSFRRHVTARSLSRTSHPSASNKSRPWGESSGGSATSSTRPSPRPSGWVEHPHPAVSRTTSLFVYLWNVKSISLMC